MPAATDTLRLCLTPNWGISSTPSTAPSTAGEQARAPRCRAPPPNALLPAALVARHGGRGLLEREHLHTLRLQRFNGCHRVLDAPPRNVVGGPEGRFEDVPVGRAGRVAAEVHLPVRKASAVRNTDPTLRPLECGPGQSEGAASRPPQRPPGSAAQRVHGGGVVRLSHQYSRMV